MCILQFVYKRFYKMKRTIIPLSFKVLAVIALGAAATACAGRKTAAVLHTFFSQFMRSDSLQVSEIWGPPGSKLINAVGHHGPAVENQYMALRLYFDGRGAIDVYNKSGKTDNELGRWLWYPSMDQQQTEGAGGDSYYVGKTVGLGGVRLWDSEQEVRLEETKGRRSLVGRTDEGAYMEMIHYGVPFQNDSVDVSLRVDVYEGSRWAKVTVREINGKPLRFATGVNYPEGALVHQGSGWAAVWGEHPSDLFSSPVPIGPIGAAIRYDPQQFPHADDTGNAVRLVSVPLSEFSTHIVAASHKEDVLNLSDRFFAFVESNNL